MVISFVVSFTPYFSSIAFTAASLIIATRLIRVLFGLQFSEKAHRRLLPVLQQYNAG
jgi:hypothetical protein